MTPIVARYLTDWYAAGFDLFNWFIFYSSSYDGPYGTWGVTNDMLLTTSSKLEGIRNVTRSKLPAITAGQGLPKTIIASNRAFNPDKSGYWKVRDIQKHVIYFSRI